MKQKFYTFLVLLLLAFWAPKIMAQNVDVCASVSGNTLTFVYQPNADFIMPPFNFWNSQLVTIRYPNTVSVTWGAITQLSNFSWQADPATPGIGVDGGDGFIYKTFYSANTPMQELMNGVDLDVFSVVITPSTGVTFELITNNTWTNANAKNVAINNAITANEFGAFSTSCGSQTYVACDASTTSLDGAAICLGDDGDITVTGGTLDDGTYTFTYDLAAPNAATGLTASVTLSSGTGSMTIPAASLTTTTGTQTVTITQIEDVMGCLLTGLTISDDFVINVLPDVSTLTIVADDICVGDDGLVTITTSLADGDYEFTYDLEAPNAAIDILDTITVSGGSATLVIPADSLMSTTVGQVLIITNITDGNSCTPASALMVSDTFAINDLPDVSTLTIIAEDICVGFDGSVAITTSLADGSYDFTYDLAAPNAATGLVGSVTVSGGAGTLTIPSASLASTTASQTVTITTVTDGNSCAPAGALSVSDAFAINGLPDVSTLTIIAEDICVGDDGNVAITTSLADGIYDFTYDLGAPNAATGLVGSVVVSGGSGTLTIPSANLASTTASQTVTITTVTDGNSCAPVGALSVSDAFAINGLPDVSTLTIIAEDICVGFDGSVAITTSLADGTYDFTYDLAAPNAATGLVGSVSISGGAGTLTIPLANLSTTAASQTVTITNVTDGNSCSPASSLNVSDAFAINGLPDVSTLTIVAEDICVGFDGSVAITSSLADGTYDFTYDLAAPNAATGLVGSVTVSGGSGTLTIPAASLTNTAVAQSVTITTVTDGNSCAPAGALSVSDAFAINGLPDVSTLTIAADDICVGDDGNVTVTTSLADGTYDFTYDLAAPNAATGLTASVSVFGGSATMTIPAASLTNTSASQSVTVTNVTDGNSCAPASALSVSDDFAINGLPDVSTLTIAADDICVGDDGNVAITTSLADGTYDFTYDLGAPNTATGLVGSVTVSGGSGTLTIPTASLATTAAAQSVTITTVTDGNSCSPAGALSVSDDFAINGLPDVSTLTIAADDICVGDDGNVTVTTSLADGTYDFTYDLAAPNAATDLTASVSVSGGSATMTIPAASLTNTSASQSVTVTNVTDGNSCAPASALSVSDAFAINGLPDVSTLTIVAEDICVGFDGSVAITTSLADGTYDFTYDLAAPNAATGLVGSVTVSGGSGTLTIPAASLTNTAAAQSVTITTVTDGNSCSPAGALSVSNDFAINGLPDVSTLTIVAEDICVGFDGSVAITTSLANGTYDFTYDLAAPNAATGLVGSVSISGGAGTLTIPLANLSTTTASQTVTITNVTDGNSCSPASSLNVSDAFAINGLPDVSTLTIVAEDICVGFDGSVAITTSLADGTYDFTYDLAAPNAATGLVGSVTVSGGSGTLTIPSANLASTTASQTVTITTVTDGNSCAPAGALSVSDAFAINGLPDVSTLTIVAEDICVGFDGSVAITTSLADGTYDFTYDLAAPNAATGLVGSVTVSGGSGTLTIPTASLSATTASQTLTITNVTDGNSCSPASSLSVSDAFAINGLPDVSTLTIVAEDICAGFDGSVAITTSLANGTYDFTYDLAAPNAATGLVGSVSISGGAGTLTIPLANLSTTTAAQTVTITNVTDGNSCSPASPLSVSDAFAINALPDVSTLTIVADDICVGFDGNVAVTTSLADGTYDFTYDLAAPNAATGLVGSVAVSGGSGTLTIPTASLSATTASQTLTITNVTDGNGCSPASSLSVSDAFAINGLPNVSTLTIVADDICVGEDGSVAITTSLADGTYDLTYDLGAPNAATGVVVSISVIGGSATLTIPAAGLTSSTASQSVTITNVTDGNGCSPASALSVSDAFAINALPDVSTLTIVADDICVGFDGSVAVTTSLADGSYDFTYDLAAPNAATGLVGTVAVAGGSGTLTISAASLTNTAAVQSVTITTVTDGNSCFPASSLNVSDDFAINALPDVSTLTIVADDICVGFDGSATITSSLADGTYDITYDLGAPNNANDLVASVTISGGSGVLTIPAGSLTSTSASQSIILMSIMDANGCTTTGSLSVSDAFAINGLPDVSTLTIVAEDICVGFDGSVAITTSLANGTYDFTYDLAAPNAATGLVGSVTISGGAGTLTIPLANLSTTTAAQTVTITNVTDGNDCSPASSLSVSDAFAINGLPDVSTLTIVAEDICVGFDGSVAITTSLADGSYDFTYDLGAPNAATGLVGTVAIAGGSGTLTIPAASLSTTTAAQTVTITTVTDGNSCFPASSLNVSDDFAINALPDVSTLTIVADDICVGFDGSATITSSLVDGTYDITYDLGAPNNANDLVASVTISGGSGVLTIPAGNLTSTSASQSIILMSILDANGCTTTGSLSVSDAFAINGLPDVSTLTIVAEDICVGFDGSVAITTSLANGTYDFTYDLAAPNAATGLVGSVSISGGAGTLTIPLANLSTTTASQTVTITNVTDGNSCSPASSLNVSDAFAINGLPDVSTLTIVAEDICVGFDGSVAITTSLADGTYDFTYDLAAPNAATGLVGSVTVSGGSGTLTIPTASLSATAASQTLTITNVTDGNSCSPASSLSVSDAFAINGLPNVSTLTIVADDICVGEDGSVAITTSLADGTYDLTYDLGAPNAAAGVVASISVSGGSATLIIPAAGLTSSTASQSVTITNVTDGNGCSPASALSVSDAFAINALPDVSTLTIVADDICVGFDGSVAVTTSLADGSYDFTYDLGAPNAATGLVGTVAVAGGSGTLTIPAASLTNTGAAQSVTITTVTDGNSCFPASSLNVSDDFAINALPDVSTLTIVADDICVGFDGSVTITSSLVDGTYDITYDLGAPNNANDLVASVTISSGSGVLTIPAGSLTSTSASQSIILMSIMDANGCTTTGSLSVSDAFAINGLPDVSTLTIDASDICVGFDGSVAIITSLANGTYDFTYDLAAPNAATGLVGSVTISGGAGTLTIPLANLSTTTAAQTVTITNVTDGNSCSPASPLSVSDAFAINALPDVSTLTIVADDICVGFDGNVAVTTSLADGTYDFTYDLAAPNAATGLVGSVAVSGGSGTLTIPTASLSATTASQTLTITNVTDGNGCSPASSLSVSDAFAINGLPNVSTLTMVADDICVGEDGSVAITTSLADGTYDLTYDLGAPNAATGVVVSISVIGGSATLTIPAAGLTSSTASQSVTITNVTDGNDCSPASALSVSDAFAINALPDVSTLMIVADDICVGFDGSVAITTSLADGSYDFTYDLGAPNAATGLVGTVAVAGGSGTLTIPAASLTNTAAAQSVTITTVTDGNSCFPASSLNVSDDFAINALPDVSTLTIVADDICVGFDGSATITSSLADGTYDITYDLGAPNNANDLVASVTISGGSGVLTIPAGSLTSTSASQSIILMSIMDANGCTTTGSLSVSDAFAINGLPDVSTLTIVAEDICVGFDGSVAITSSLANGTYDFTYDLAAPNAATGLVGSVSISGGAGTLAIPTANLSTTTAAQTVTITNVTDGNDCSPAGALSVSDAFAINGLPDVSTLTIVAEDICVGDDGNVAITTSLADGTYDFTYDLAAPNAATGLVGSVTVSGGSGTLTIPTASLATTAATQSVTITTVTDGNSCAPAGALSVSDAFAINGLPNVSTLTMVADDICVGEDGNVAITTSLADGTYDLTYDLGAPNAATGVVVSISVSGGSATLTIPAAGLTSSTASQSVTITNVTDGNGCSPASALSVSDAFAINALPDVSTLTIVADDICVGFDGSVAVTTSLADGSYDFTYDLGAPNAATGLVGTVAVAGGSGTLTIPAASLTNTVAAQSVTITTVTDGNSCFPASSLNVSDDFAINALPDVSTLTIVADDICVGFDGSVTITSSLIDGTYDITYDLGAPNNANDLVASVTISGGSGVLTIPASNLTSTSASQSIILMSIMDANGCTTTGSLSVSDAFAINGLPDVSTLTLDASDICVGFDGSVAITSSLANGTYDFTYDLAAPNAATGLVGSVSISGGAGTLMIPLANLSTTTAAQTVTITNVTDGNSCSPASPLSVSDAFAINALPDASDLSISVAEVCVGDDGVMMVSSSTLGDGAYSFTYGLSAPNAATGLTGNVTISGGMGTFLIPTANLSNPAPSQTVTITSVTNGNNCASTGLSASDDFVINDLPDCTCALTIMGVGTPGACNGDGTYDVDVTVTYTAPGTSGFIINGQVFAYTSRPQTVTLTLPGDGSITNLHAWDIDTPSCGDVMPGAYTAPDCSGMGCAMAITDVGTPGACDDGAYDVEVTVTYIGTSGTGFMLNGQTFAYTSSPQTVTVNLPGDGSLTTLNVWDAGNPDCRDSFASAFTAPDCTGGECVIAITNMEAPGDCNGTDGTYDVVVTVTYANTTGTGFVLNGQEFTYTASPQTVTVTLPGDGSLTSLHVWDQGNPGTGGCSAEIIDGFTAPDCSGGDCNISITNVNPAVSCNGDGTYDVTVTVTYTNTAGTGFVLNGEEFAYTSSPQVVTLTLPGDGSSTKLKVFDLGNAECSDQLANAFTAPDCPGACAISITDIDFDNISDCNLATSTYTVPVTITYANPAGPTFTVNGNTFAYMVSPQTVMLTLNADGNMVTLTVVDDTEGGCTASWANAFTAPVACEPPALLLTAKVFLQASYDVATDIMRDDLRAAGYLPVNEPYSSRSNFTHVGGGGGETVNPTVFAVTGNDAIVDWVFLELRDAADSTQVLATRSALVQRDGDIVDVDGTSPVAFVAITSGDYYLAVRHRNHLGVMTQNALSLSGIATSVDFTNGATPTYGNYAQKVVEPGVTALWAGNANGNAQIVYVGGGTDITTISITVLLDPDNAGVFSSSHPVDGYYDADVTMNGTVIYVGSGTDQTLISANVLLHPANSSFSQSTPIFEQIPTP